MASTFARVSPCAWPNSLTSLSYCFRASCGAGADIRHRPDDALGLEAEHGGERVGGNCRVDEHRLNQGSRHTDAAEDCRYPVGPGGVCMAVSKVEFEKAVAFDEHYVRDSAAFHAAAQLRRRTV